VNQYSDWIFKINSIKKSFYGKTSYQSPDLVFNEIYIQRGSLTIITGETGIGKTTLLNMLGLMDEMTIQEPDDILFKPFSKARPISYQKIINDNPSDIEKLRYRYYGFMFQQDHLIDSMTGWENVILPYLLRYPKSNVTIAKNKAEKLIDECKFDDMLHGLMDRSPSTYSGGQRHRAALIRSLIHDPTAIFADEPLASVDKQTARDIVTILARQSQKGKTIIMVVHDTHEYIFEGIQVNKIELKVQD